MVRQCAWCLRLINEAGEPISVFPMPKRYDASHGMCRACGVRWMAAVEAVEAMEAEAAGTMGTGEDLGSQNGIMLTPRPDELISPLPARRMLPAAEPLQPEEANDNPQLVALCFA